MNTVALGPRDRRRSPGHCRYQRAEIGHGGTATVDNLYMVSKRDVNLEQGKSGFGNNRENKEMASNIYTRQHVKQIQLSHGTADQ